jgi:hypothetical protein
MDTFVVRLWTAAVQGAGVDRPLRGFVDHVRSGRSVAFQGGGELVAAILACAGEMRTNRHADREQEEE